MFARAVSRESELVVRWALGATRARIAGQLFAEALVLGGLAALVGLLAANAGVRWFIAMQQADSGGRNPFWFEGGIAPDTILYVAGLTLLGAAVAGIVPALKVTDGRVGVRLKQAGSSGGVRFGGVWTAVIVAQVAVTLAFPATSFYFQRYVTQMRSVDLGFAASEFLTARIELDETPVAERSATAESAPAAARLDVVWRELALLLASETGVSGVTPADRLPGMLHEQRWIEVEAIGNEDGAPFRVGSARVDTDFLDVIGSTVRAGRGFQVGDAVSAAGPVLVNDGFVERVLNGRSAVGRRIRYAATDDGQPGPWFEIVGVTANLGMLGGSGDPPGSEPGFYRLLARGEAIRWRSCRGCAQWRPRSIRRCAFTTSGAWIASLHRYGRSPRFSSGSSPESASLRWCSRCPESTPQWRSQWRVGRARSASAWRSARAVAA
jgi:hypothetical protein